MGASADDVAGERDRVEHEGWGARLLAAAGPDGQWDGGACFPAGYRGGEPGQPWTPTMHTLQTLQLFGLDPASESARRAIALVIVRHHDQRRRRIGRGRTCDRYCGCGAIASTGVPSLRFGAEMDVNFQRFSQGPLFASQVRIRW